MRSHTTPPYYKYGFMIAILVFAIWACNIPEGASSSTPTPAAPVQPTASPAGEAGSAATPVPALSPAVEPPAVLTPELPTAVNPFASPTPDAPHNLPEIRSEPVEYTVQAGDSMGKIAQDFDVTIEEIVKENGVNSGAMQAGQKLTIPVHPPSPSGPSFKIIPDSEAVYSPGSIDFNIGQFIAAQNGYLADYAEWVEDQKPTGSQIVQRVAEEYSVNPRLLLAVLEYQSGWVTQPDPDTSTLQYPIGFEKAGWKGLYYQLSWAADNLNHGYYLWRFNEENTWRLADETIIPISPVINAGTAAVQALFARLDGQADWEEAVSENGVYATYNALFGFPFSRAVEPLIPVGLTQPVMQLPFELGEVWNFTGGPHTAWGEHSPWAALDFAPPGNQVGCVASNAWVVAMADGPVVRAELGQVIQDIDIPGAPADGLEQTGWVVLYMHIETRDRVEPGAYLHAGNRIGHPSCEGGHTTGTHVHVARRYNGEWISADRDLPFVMDGWVSSGTSIEYDGYLSKDGNTIVAYAGRDETSKIQR